MEIAEKTKPERKDRGGATYQFEKIKSVKNLFKRGDGYWFGRVMTFGKRRKKCLGKIQVKEGDGGLVLAEAKEALRKWLSQTEGWNFEPSSVPKNTTLGDCMTAVETSETAKNISYDHRRFIRSRFQFIREKWPEFETLMPDAISAAEITAWVDRMRLKYSAATLRGTLIYMKKTFAYAHENKVLFANPMLKIKAPSVPRRGGDRREMSVADFDMILAEMRNNKYQPCHRAADLAELLSTTGTRISEIAGKGTSRLPGLKWKDVNWEQKEVTIYGAKFSRSKQVEPTPRTIPFHPRLQSLLERLKQKPHKPTDMVSPSSTAKKSLFGAVRRLHKQGKIKFDKLSHHDLRHMFATQMVEAGVDIPTVADLLGHKDGGAVLLAIYRHKRTEHLHNAMLKVK